MKEHEEVLQELDFVPSFEDISVDVPEGETLDVRMHDGSHLRIRKLSRDFDPTNRLTALAAMEAAETEGEVLTGVLYVNENKLDLLGLLNLCDLPLATLPQDTVRPAKVVLEEVMEELR